MIKRLKITLQTRLSVTSAVDPLEERVTRSDTNASQNDRNLLVSSSSVVQHSAHSVTGGLGVVAGYLSTTADLTKEVIPSFALPPYWRHVAVKRHLNRRKEGRCVCVCVLNYSLPINRLQSSIVHQLAFVLYKTETST